MNELFIILIILIGCIGIMLYFVGWINCIFMALGKDEKLKALFILIINPVAIYFCLQNWPDEKKQGLQMILGLIIMCITIIPSYLYIDNLT